MRCGYFHNMYFFVPETELGLQLLTAGILVWEGMFTLSEEHSSLIFRKNTQVKMTTVFQRQIPEGRIINKSNP